MTGTGDFRRYSYNGDAAYAVEAFSRTRSSAAPAPKTGRAKRLSISPATADKGLRTVKKPVKQLVREQRAARVKALQVAAAVVFLVAMFSAVLFTFVQKNELTRSIADTRRQISVSQSDNVSLNAELESLVSVSQIDSYAVEQLGMTRLQANQITYIDTADYAARREYEAQQEKAQQEKAQQQAAAQQGE